jgi:hypothetical protein
MQFIQSGLDSSLCPLLFRQPLERGFDVLVVNDNAAFRTTSLGAKLGAQVVDVDSAVLEVGAT